jgi:hypothetical protein
MDASTQFTSDRLADKPSICERSRCGARIEVGEPRHYYRSINPKRPGKYVCGKCANEYNKNPATTLRGVLKFYYVCNPSENTKLLGPHSSDVAQGSMPPPAAHLSLHNGSEYGIDTQRIRADVNASQRRGMASPINMTDFHD